MFHRPASRRPGCCIPDLGSFSPVKTSSEQAQDAVPVLLDGLTWPSTRTPKWQQQSQAMRRSPLALHWKCDIFWMSFGCEVGYFPQISQFERQGVSSWLQWLSNHKVVRETWEVCAKYHRSSPTLLRTIHCSQYHPANRDDPFCFGWCGDAHFVFWIINAGLHCVPFIELPFGSSCNIFESSSMPNDILNLPLLCYYETLSKSQIFWTCQVPSHVMFYCLHVFKGNHLFLITRWIECTACGQPYMYFRCSVCPRDFCQVEQVI
jgi:hypothetical protein